MTPLKPNASKLDKVCLILKVAKELNNLDNRLFDSLMDTADKYPLYLDFIVERLLEEIWEKTPISIQIEEFDILVRYNNFYDYFNHTVKQYQDYQLNN